MSKLASLCLGLLCIAEGRIFDGGATDEPFPFVANYAYGAGAGSLQISYTYPDPKVQKNARLLLFDANTWATLYPGYSANTLTCAVAESSAFAQIKLPDQKNQPDVSGGVVAQAIAVASPVIFYFLAAGDDTGTAGPCGPVTMSWTLTLLQPNGSQLSYDEVSLVQVLWVAWAIVLLVAGAHAWRHYVKAKPVFAPVVVVLITVALVLYVGQLLLLASEFSILASSGVANQGVAIASLLLRGLTHLCLLCAATLAAIGYGITSYRWARPASLLALGILAVFCALYGAASVFRIALLDDEAPVPSFEGSWPAVLLMVLFLVFMVWVAYLAFRTVMAETRPGSDKRRAIIALTACSVLYCLILPSTELAGGVAASYNRTRVRTIVDVCMHIVMFACFVYTLGWTDFAARAFSHVANEHVASLSSSSALLLQVDNDFISLIGGTASNRGDGHGGSGDSRGPMGSMDGGDGTTHGEDMGAIYKSLGVIMPGNANTGGGDGHYAAITGRMSMGGGRESIASPASFSPPLVPGAAPLSPTAGALELSPALGAVASASGSSGGKGAMTELQLSPPPQEPRATVPSAAAATTSVSVVVKTSGEGPAPVPITINVASPDKSVGDSSISRTSSVPAATNAPSTSSAKAVPPRPVVLSGQSSSMSPSASPGRIASTKSTSSSASSGAVPPGPGSKLTPLSPLASSAAIAASLRHASNKGSSSPAASSPLVASAAVPAPAPTAAPVVVVPTSVPPPVVATAVAENRKSKRGKQDKLSREQTATLALKEAEAAAAAAAAVNTSGAAGAGTSSSGLLDTSLLSADELLGRESLITGGDLSFYTTGSPASMPTLPPPSTRKK